MSAPTGKLKFAYQTISNMEKRIQELEKQLAKKSIIEYKESEEIKLESSLEQLRYFCSIAFSKDDWINSENFFIALEKQLSESIPKSEIEKILSFRCTYSMVKVEQIKRLLKEGD